MDDVICTNFLLNSCQKLECKYSKRHKPPCSSELLDCYSPKTFEEFMKELGFTCKETQ